MRVHKGRVTGTDAVEFLLFEERFPRSLRYCVRSAVGLARRIWPAELAAIGGAPLARLAALDVWLGERKLDVEPSSIHDLLTHVVDETALVCSEARHAMSGATAASEPDRRSARRRSNDPRSCFLRVRNPPETQPAPESEVMLNTAERNRSVQVHERADRSLDGIFRLIEAAGQPRPLGEVLARMCADVAVIAAAAVVSVYVRDGEGPDGDGQVFTLRGNVGFPADSVGRVHLRQGEGITGFVAERLLPVSVAVADRDEHFKYIPGLGEERFPAMLAVPVVRGGVAAAVLVLQRGPDHEFASEEVVLATALAAVINHALERADERERAAARGVARERAPAGPRPLRGRRHGARRAPPNARRGRSHGGAGRADRRHRRRRARAPRGRRAQARRRRLGQRRARPRERDAHPRRSPLPRPPRRRRGRRVAAQEHVRARPRVRARGLHGGRAAIRRPRRS